jgi:hypothetical protein
MEQQIGCPNTDGEIWTEMWDYPNYEVSNLGRVRRAKNEKVIKQRQDGNEYKMVSLWSGKKKYTKRVGRLIWQSFNKCDCKETIDHINRDRGDDSLGNLRCITSEEQYKNKSKITEKNKYNLTPEIKALIQRKYTAGEWTTWQIMKMYGIPLNYVRTTMVRGSWEKYANDETL